MLAGLVALAQCLVSCDREPYYPIDSLEFAMDSVAFYGESPKLFLESGGASLDMTVSVSIDGNCVIRDSAMVFSLHFEPDTLVAAVPLEVGTHELSAVALGCCGRYASGNFTFRVLPAVEAVGPNIFISDSIVPLELRIMPREYAALTEVTEADDSVMATRTEVTPTGFVVTPVFRSVGSSVLTLTCLGHTYRIPLEFRQRWISNSQYRSGRATYTDREEL